MAQQVLLPGRVRPGNCGPRARQGVAARGPAASIRACAPQAGRRPGALGDNRADVPALVGAESSMRPEARGGRGCPDERRPSPREDAEAAGPGRLESGHWVAPAAAVAAALAAVSLSGWRAAGGGGPCALLLGLGLHLLCATAAFLLGTLLALVCRGPRAPPPDFAAAWSRAARRSPARPGCGRPESVRGRRAVISQSVDRALKDVLERSYRDYVLPWCAGLGRGERRLHRLLAEDFWAVAARLRARLGRVDAAKVLCADVARAVLGHLCALRAAGAAREQRPRPFALHASLGSPGAEARFLRGCARVLLLCLLPAPRAPRRALRTLLADALAAKVLAPLAQLLSDPDYINRTLLGHLERREQAARPRSAPRARAPSREELVGLINGSSDVAFLQQLRTQIVVEIVHATAAGSCAHPKRPKRREAAAGRLRARGATRYLAQLSAAKQQCERRIRVLRGPAGGAPRAREGSAGPPGPQPPAFREILANASQRERFRTYLARAGRGALVSFWESVECLKRARKDEVPQKLGEIFQNFFVDSEEVSVEKSLYKEMQQGLAGNQGIEVFCKIQADVYEALKARYYPSFVLSDLFEEVMPKEEEKRASHLGSNKDETGREGEASEGAADGLALGTNGEDSSAVNTLRGVNAKIEYKRQTPNSTPNAPKPDKKIVSKLKGEITRMRKEGGKLSLRKARPEARCGPLGLWRASVAGGEVAEEDGEQVPWFVVSVRSPGLGGAGGKHWMVPRRLSEFQHLQRRLSRHCPSLKKAQLPSLSELPFKSIDQKFLEKSKSQLNKFLRTLLSDERLGQSEALCAFLCPSLDCLEVTDVQGIKNPFSLASFLERLPGDFSHREEEPEEDGALSDGEDGGGRTDALAEQCFMLMAEIFELRGMFKWVRRTLMALVQVTFGRTINKQIRDTVNWVFSEPMLVYYIDVFRDAFWPNGKLAPPTASRSEAQIQETKQRARQKLLENVPDVLQSLVGQQNARHGIIKIFNALQEARANKHLLYVLMELLLLELCPELRTHLDQLKAVRV